jgi:hypothetical protein
MTAIGREPVEVFRKYAELVTEDGPCQTMSDLTDRYLREVAPKKAPRTYKDNVRQARFLRAYFGSMKLADNTQPHIYRYRDERGKTQANRELSHMFHPKYGVRVKTKFDGAKESGFYSDPIPRSRSHLTAGMSW